MTDEEQIIIDLANCVRVLSVDAIEKAGSGHPGMPLGMADVFTVLVNDFLRFIPQDPCWFNRDLLILSAGHGSMLLYSFYYLAGYRNFNLDDLKSFRQLGSKCQGHPEYGVYEAIETTTGPLGQGVANAVGIAIAQKKYQVKLGSKLCNYKIYCVVGDGCLMEGISYEALSLAGHLRLDNLIIIFDDNNITIDGTTDLTISENQLDKFAAMGLFSQEVDGHNPSDIRRAIKKACSANKPSFIACKTKIGQGLNKKLGSNKSHGSPVGYDEISYLKQNINFEDEPFFIPDRYLHIWRNLWKKHEESYNRWNEEYRNTSQENKEYLKPRPLVLNKKPNFDCSESTRVSFGKIL